ncbi:hypothetical protein GCM10025862_07980 [Arsenicicoccus piscis]|uniref:HTH tetR-type domain-containing protein n=2 Tax=Arsenicicoccus piscis TaxID=673954 RepID=A0ABQ6HKA0_9MICO|nr:hypothetical protein GCM10025862_07980 [Arsenicicoccus piscis]
MHLLHSVHLIYRKDMQTRRDLAKQETRLALVDAALAVAEREALEGLTADSVAAEAGVSRRTFFNYFPTTDAVLAAPTHDFLQRVFAELSLRPVREPVPEAIVNALAAAAEPDLMRRFAGVVRLCGDDFAAERVEREVWAEAEANVREALTERLPAGTEPLRIQVLAAAAMGAGRAAVVSWADEVGQVLDDSTGVESLDPAAFTSLRERLVAAMGYLGQGFGFASPAAPTGTASTTTASTSTAT